MSDAKRLKAPREGTHVSLSFKGLLSAASALAIGLHSGISDATADSFDYGNCSPPLRSEANQSDPEAAWNVDRRVFVSETVRADGRRFKIVGDIVELSPELFPSLYRQDGQYLEDVAEITVEAREIIVGMPIRLTSGAVSMTADRVTFKFDGLVSFVRPPATANQSLKILTGILDLSSARSKPLLFASTDWTPPAEGPRWNAPGKTSRSVEIAAGKIFPRMDAVTAVAPEAAKTFIVNLTLDASKPDGDWSNAYTVSAGSVADQAYAQALRTKLEWPDATAMKLQRIFSLDPYGTATRDFTARAVTNFREVFAIRASKMAEAGLLRLERANMTETDLFGLASTSVPMTSVAGRLDRFKAMLATLYGTDGDGDSGLMKLWDEQAAMAGVAASVDAERVKDIQKDIKRKTDEYAVLAATMEQRENALANVEAQISGLDAQMQNRETHLRQIFEAEQEDRRAKGEQLKAVQTAAAVGSVMFPAAAPVLAGASGLYAASVEIGDTDDMPTMIATVQGIAERHAAIVDLSSKIRKDWTTVRGDFGQAVDYVRKRGNIAGEDRKKFEGWRKAVESVRSNSEKLYKSLERPASGEKLQFDREDAAKDAEMVKLLGQRNDAVKVQQSLQNELIALRKDFDFRATEILEGEAVIAELLTLQLANDEARLRYRQLSDWARRTLIRDLAREASLLRRSLAYATGNQVELPLDALLFAEGDLVESYGTPAEPAQLESALADARKKRAAMYGLLLSQAQTAYNDLKDQNRWNVPTPIVFTADYKATAGDSGLLARRKKFLDDLNTEIEGAIADVDSRTSIRIPFEPDLIGTTEGSVLLGINIAKVTFAAEPEANLVLKVDHPRFGAMRRPNGCVIVGDLVNSGPEGSELGSVSWPTTVPSGVNPDWQDTIVFANQLARIQDAMFPFFTGYRMTVEVPEPDEWSTPPRIEAIEVQFIVAKPN